MRIGNIEVENPIFLAPMAGVTDWAFRTVCAKLGAGVTVTEMVSSRALVYKDQKSAKLLKKNVDMICANNLKQEGAGFGVDTNVITLITKDELLELPLQTKLSAAHAILNKALTL